MRGRVGRSWSRCWRSALRGISLCSLKWRAGSRSVRRFHAQRGLLSVRAGEYRGDPRAPAADPDVWVDALPVLPRVGADGSGEPGAGARWGVARGAAADHHAGELSPDADGWFR